MYTYMKLDKAVAGITGACSGVHEYRYVCVCVLVSYRREDVSVIAADGLGFPAVRWFWVRGFACVCVVL